MHCMYFQTIGLLKFEWKFQSKKQFTGRYCREYAKSKHACVSSKLVFKFSIGKYVRILRLIFGIVCGVSKDNAAVGARLYSFFCHSFSFGANQILS